MGFGLPAAIGAQIGRPDKTVILVVGDGGIQMTIQELTTIAQEKINLKILLLNNGFLGMVRQWQELFFDRRYSSTPMHNPDFMKLCDGFGVQSAQVKERAHLDEEIKKMLDYDGAYLLEVLVEPEENVFPMVPSGASVSDVLLGENLKADDICD